MPRLNDSDAFEKIHDALGCIDSLETLRSVQRLLEMRANQLPVEWKREFVIDEVQPLLHPGRKGFYTLTYDEGVQVTLELKSAPVAGKSRIRFDSDFTLPASEIEIVAGDGSTERRSTDWPKLSRKLLSERR